MTSEGFTLQFAIRLPDGNLALNPITSQPLLWADEAGAEKVLGMLRTNAASIGVSDWAGEIVRRLCTPFVSVSDPAEQLVAELSEWLKQQAGEPK